jgi:mannose-6-phosphate isomerase class I
LTENRFLRKTEQYLLPLTSDLSEVKETYNIFPSHVLCGAKIFKGFEDLSEIFREHRVVLIDGYQGVFFEKIVHQLTSILTDKGKKVSLSSTYDAMRPVQDIDSIIAPYLGGDDPVFGKVTTLSLSHFFDEEKVSQLTGDDTADITFIYGPGAFLSDAEGLRVYIDLPKNELQFRARAKSIFNLGSDVCDESSKMYKRFYFVDWQVLNRHKASWAKKIDIMADGQQLDDIIWASGIDIRKGLHELSRNVFRARPWFEPGVWGGTWIMNHIDGLNKDVKNYAWSFELITPENGIIFTANGLNLEISFDFLMYQEGRSVLGSDFGRFGHEFPIRFDFLDTFDGGNLSVQCHPTEDYIKEHFNENFTQEETYYILNAREDATVYLGFQEDIDQREFRTALQSSFKNGQAMDIEKYVQKLPAKKHDLFLIPPGTIHASGINNLVLEISATPYIYTFKMYDWVRPDLTGKPRPLNIQRGFENLDFTRKGSKVQDELISHPNIIECHEAWTLWHLPTHLDHLYDVHRICLKSQIHMTTEDKCHVLSLVEGKSIRVKTQNGTEMVFHYAETFVIPAAAGSYTIINEGDSEVMIIKAFVK